MIEAMVRKQRPAILSHTVIPIHQLTQILIYTFNCGQFAEQHFLLFLYKIKVQKLSK